MGGNWTEISTGLKLFVITMTGLLVIGSILLVVGMIRTSGKMVEEAEAEQAARQSVEAAGPRGEHHVALPAGTRLVSIAADGGLLYLHLVDAAGRPRILVLDAASGEQRARIHLEPTP